MTSSLYGWKTPPRGIVAPATLIKCCLQPGQSEDVELASPSRESNNHDIPKLTAFQTGCVSGTEMDCMELDYGRGTLFLVAIPGFFTRL